jgi:hypothetical protein
MAFIMWYSANCHCGSRGGCQLQKCFSCSSSYLEPQHKRVLLISVPHFSCLGMLLGFISRTHSGKLTEFQKSPLFNKSTLGLVVSWAYQQLNHSKKGHHISTWPLRWGVRVTHCPAQTPTSAHLKGKLCRINRRQSETVLLIVRTSVVMFSLSSCFKYDKD